MPFKIKSEAAIIRARKIRLEHYYRNKDKYLIKQKRLNKEYRQKGKDLRDSLKTPCVICGESDKCCIDFHHLNPKLKSFSVSVAANQSSLGALREEASKCVCLCSNCHRKLHAGKVALPVGLEPTTDRFGDGDSTN